MEYDLHPFHTCPIIQMPSFTLLPSSIDHYRPLCWAQVWFFSSNLNLSTFSVLQKIIPKKMYLYVCVSGLSVLFYGSSSYLTFYKWECLRALQCISS